MVPDLATRNTPRPSREELLADFGEEYLSIQSLFQFCFVPGGRLNLLKELTPIEEWGQNNFVLLKYLAVHVRLAIEQGRYLWNGDQIVLAAGRLSSTKGMPLYIGLVQNSTPDENPWVLNWVGERPSTAELPEPADLGCWPAFEPGREVVIACDLSAEDRRARLGTLADLEPLIQGAAIAGAVHWALYRRLFVRQIHGGGRGYFVPVYLTSRDDLTIAPEFVAPIQVQGERLIVRTLLEPHVAYSPARAVVERWEQLPPWLLDAWDTATGAGDAGRSDDEEGADDGDEAEDDEEGA
jgi:hypothetical protein